MKERVRILSTVKATLVEAAGKTVLPGLIDVHVHLVAPGGFYADMSKYDPEAHMLRNLAAYLYSGVTAVRSVGDPLDLVLKVRSSVNSGERLGAELFTCGPLFTAQGGHGTEYFKDLPPKIREQAEAQFTRIPASAEEARRQVDELKHADVDCIKAVLESRRRFERLQSSRQRDLSSHRPGGSRSTIASRSAYRRCSRCDGCGFRRCEFHRAWFVPRTHSRRVVPANGEQENLLRSDAQRGRGFQRLCRRQERSSETFTGAAGRADGPDRRHREGDGVRRHRADARAHRAVSHRCGDRDEESGAAYRDGVNLVTGSDAGNFLVVHGPTVQHELELWVRAGIPPAVALQAATYNAARLLRAENHIGSIRVGNDADLLLVDGNPLEDITAVERISIVVFKGEQLDRSDLFTQE